MKLLDALRVGMEILAAAETVKTTGLEKPVRWSWQLGKWMIRLHGAMSATRLP